MQEFQLHCIDHVSMLSSSGAEVKLRLLRLRQHITLWCFGAFLYSLNPLREILLPRPNEISIESEPRSQ